VGDAGATGNDALARLEPFMCSHGADNVVSQ
jgi:hypothetical protein